MTPPRPAPRWLAVRSVRNSRCGTARLPELDWSHWRTDASCGMHYLHVPDERGIWHTVTCCHSQTPRLGLRRGKLHWIVD